MSRYIPEYEQDSDKNTITIINALCKFHVILPCTGRYNTTYHVLVFNSPTSGKDYVWTTTTAGIGYEEGKTYNIKAKYIPDKNNKLQYVKLINQSEVLKLKRKSEQPDDKFKDAIDILFPKICYTLDNKLKV